MNSRLRPLIGNHTTLVCSSCPNRFGNPTAAPAVAKKKNQQISQRRRTPTRKNHNNGPRLSPGFVPFVPGQPMYSIKRIIARQTPTSSPSQTPMLIPIVLFSKRYFPLPIFFVLSSRLGLAGRGSLEGLLAPQLGLGVGLDGELGLADGGGTLDSGLTEVSAVAGLGDLAGNGLVGPKLHQQPLISCFPTLPFDCRNTILLSKSFVKTLTCGWTCRHQWWW